MRAICCLPPSKGSRRIRSGGVFRGCGGGYSGVFRVGFRGNPGYSITRNVWFFTMSRRVEFFVI